MLYDTTYKALLRMKETQLYFNTYIVYVVLNNVY